jgi:hypothetical protein
MVRSAGTAATPNAFGSINHPDTGSDRAGSRPRVRMSLPQSVADRRKLSAIYPPLKVSYAIERRQSSHQISRRRSLRLLAPRHHHSDHRVERTEPTGQQAPHRRRCNQIYIAKAMPRSAGTTSTVTNAQQANA